MRAMDGCPGRRLSRLRSLSRASVLVICGTLLTVVQVVLEALDRSGWMRIVAAVIIAGMAVAAEIDRHVKDVDRADRDREGGLSPLELAAERLATVEADTWVAEAKRRGITTPAPASVRWRWASSDVAVPKHEVLSSGVVPGVLGGPGSGADVPGVLLESGVVTRLHDEVYSRLPHGRLVILGAAGAGKTGAMILLLLQALHHRRGLERMRRLEVPVPVWLTLGGWDPATHSLRAWALMVINREHPYMRAVGHMAEIAEALLASGHLALFLDGLDEMPAGMRGAALRRLDAESANMRIVLTSRIDEYRQAQDEGRLHSAAVIELRPVRPAVAATFLVRGEVGARRDAWNRVGEYLRQNPDSVAAEVLATPLALSLARSAYQSADPTDLVEPATFRSTAALREHLIKRVLDAAYPDPPKLTQAMRWLPGLRPPERAQAIKWLSWLAHHMGSGRDLAWWEIPTWAPHRRVQILMAAAAVLTGLVATYICITLLVLVSDAGINIEVSAEINIEVSAFLDSLRNEAFLGSILQLGAVGALVIWFGSRLVSARALRHSRPVRLAPRFPKRGEFKPVVRTVVLAAAAVGFGVGLLSGLGAVVWQALDRAITDGVAGPVVDKDELVVALLGVLAVGVAVGLPAGLVIALFRVWSTPVADAVASTPYSSYRDDRRARRSMALLGGAAIGSSVAAVIVSIYGILSGSVHEGIAAGLVFGAIAALAVTLVGCRVFGLSSTLRFTEYVLRAPQFIPLLEDARRRDVLRQAGSVYQFRHADLQDYLARTYDGRREPPARRLV